MSSRRRDRHDRGLRGPLALPNDLNPRPASPPHPESRTAYFDSAVRAASERLARRCPEVLVGVTVGIEDVPPADPGWSGDRVPLAAALDPTAGREAQVVLYRRPLEHRAASRPGLRILVHRTLVEQLSALTGRSVQEIDPDVDDDADE